MCDRQRLSLTGGLEGLGQRPVEDPDRRAQAEGLRALARRRGGAARGHQQPDPAVIGGGQGSLQAARRDRRALLRPQPRSRRHAPDLASGPRERAQAIPAPRRRPQPIVADSAARSCCRRAPSTGRLPQRGHTRASSGGSRGSFFCPSPGRWVRPCPAAPRCCRACARCPASSAARSCCRRAPSTGRCGSSAACRGRLPASRPARPAPRSRTSDPAPRRAAGHFLPQRRDQLRCPHDCRPHPAVAFAQPRDRALPGLHQPHGRRELPVGCCQLNEGRSQLNV